MGDRRAFLPSGLWSLSFRATELATAATGGEAEEEGR
jgi:hypothetical protein